MTPLVFAALAIQALVIIGLWLLLVRQSRRDILLVHGFEHESREAAKASVAEMRKAYREAGQSVPIILHAPNHIRVERIKTT